MALALVPDEKLVRGKLLALQAGLALLLGLWLARLTADEAPQRRSGLFDLPVALYAASGLLFYLLSPERENSETELARILLSAGAYWAALQLPPAAALWRWSAVLAAGIALVQGGARPAGTFGNPLFLGSFLAASLPFCARWPLLPVGLALVLTQSRAALAGFGLAFGAFLASEKRWRHLGALAAAALLAAWLHRDRPATHWLIWSDALKLWLENPLLGCGLGRFHIEFPAHASEALRALWPQQKVIVNFAHNEYLQVLAETGILGLGVFLALPIALLLNLRRLERGPALAALTLFGAALVSPDLRFGVSAFLAFTALGLAAPARSVPIGPNLRLGLLAAGAAFLALWGTLSARPHLARLALKSEAPFHIQATPEVQAAAAGLEERLRSEPDNADLAENLAYLYAREQAWEPAVSRFELVTRLDPKRPGPWNNLGNIRYMQGRFDEAIEFWKKSLEADAGQLDAHLNLGKLLYEKGRLKESAAHLKKALELDPNNAKARVLLKKMVE